MRNVDGFLSSPAAARPTIMYLILKENQITKRKGKVSLKTRVHVSPVAMVNYHRKGYYCLWMIVFWTLLFKVFTFQTLRLQLHKRQGVMSANLSLITALCKTTFCWTYAFFKRGFGYHQVVTRKLKKKIQVAFEWLGLCDERNGIFIEKRAYFKGLYSDGKRKKYNKPRLGLDCVMLSILNLLGGVKTKFTTWQLYAHKSTFT